MAHFLFIIVDKAYAFAARASIANILRYNAP
jgi:hypothetical protein